MARLPTPDGDEDQWGSVLNEFLRVSHRDDGSLKDVGNVINVLDFGAVGDGVNDDTDAINRAISALQDGDILYFPAGRIFIIKQPLQKIDKNHILITGGGSVKGINVNGFVFTLGGILKGHCVMSHLKVIASGKTLGGVKWDHMADFVMDAVRVEDDFSTEGGVGIEVVNGGYQGVIRHCRLNGNFDKGIVISRGNGDPPFNTVPNGMQILGCWISRTAPARIGVGVSVEGGVTALRSLFNYYESWDTAIDITPGAVDGFRSLCDAFEDNRIGVNAQKGRVLVAYPVFNPGETPVEIGINFSNGAYSSDGVVLHPHRNTVPSKALVQISSGCNRIRLEMEQALIDNNVIDLGNDSVIYGQEKIQFSDVNLYRVSVDKLKTDNYLLVEKGLGVGNTIRATNPGNIIRKMEVFDAQGRSLGFIPIYEDIT